MNLQEAIANLSGLAGELKSLKEERNLSAEKLGLAEARVTELQGLLEKAPKAEAIADLEGKLNTATGERDTEKARADKADADLKALQESQPLKVNAEAAKVIAANSHAPVSTEAPKIDAEKKPGEGLTGTAKIAALLKARRETKQS